jgi:hypothetical protein
VRVGGVVVEGHRVASGANRDPRFPGGTIAMQAPHFRAWGLDLSSYHPATLNLSVAPHTVNLGQAEVTLRQVRWHPTEPAEDFSFAPCLLETARRTVDALVYWPHPDTKPRHIQSPDVVELLAPWIEGLGYGDRVTLVTGDGALVLG